MLLDIIKIVLLTFLVVYLHNRFTGKIREDFLNYKKCNKLILGNRLDSIFKEAGIKKDTEKWDLFIPCGYTNVEKELKKLKVFNKTQQIFAIDGCDRIVSKYYLWKNLTSRFGSNYSQFVPKTYGNNIKGIAKLLTNHKSGDKYIAKKDVQAQTGLLIINNISELKQVIIDRKYLVIQELLNNPFLVNSRKINIRVYFLIVCKNGKIDAYIHSNGFMYYTPNKFNYDSNDKNCHITSGYVDRKVYQENPLTLKDFYKYLDKNGHSSSNFKHNIKDLFKNIMKAANIPICNTKSLDNNVRFQLFGADVAPDNNLEVKLIEINKGPDLGAKDNKDNQVKDKVVRDVFDITGLIRGKTFNEFIKIW